MIPSYNGAALLGNCLRSLVSQTHANVEIIVVDNGSIDRSETVVRETAPAARFLRQDRNLGFAGACNAGIRAARGDWVAILNNDTEAAPDWIEQCLAVAAQHDEVSFVACRILEIPNSKRIYSAGDCFLRGGIGYRRGQEQEDHPDYGTNCRIFAVGGCAALFRRPALEKAGGYDPDYFAYFEDIDLSLRLQAEGAEGWYAGAAVVYHHGGATSGGEFAPMVVRLRTRNSWLLPGKCMPWRILLRCLPMMALTQAVWLARVLLHGRLLSYLRGLGGALLALPRVMAARSARRILWHASAGKLWQGIRESEALARADLARPGAAGISSFLNWYFRLF